MAWLKGQQPAAQRVLLDLASRREGKLFMNIVNLGEVFYLSVKARNLEYGETVLNNLHPLIRTESASDELVMDAFAAATAIVRAVPRGGNKREETQVGVDRRLNLTYF